MTNKRIIGETTHGARYGFDDEESMRRVFPDAVVVGYQDGSPYEPQAKPVSKMNREDLEAHAITLGVENPGDKELYPTVAALRDAVTGAESNDA